MAQQESTPRLDHDPAGTTFPRVSRGARTDQARVEATRIVFEFAEDQYRQGVRAGAHNALLRVSRALRRASIAEVQAAIAALHGGEELTGAALRSLDALGVNPADPLIVGRPPEDGEQP